MRLHDQKRNLYQQNARKGQDTVFDGFHPAPELAYKRCKIEDYAYLGYLRGLKCGEPQVDPPFRIALRDADEWYERQKPDRAQQHHEAHAPVKLHRQQRQQVHRRHPRQSETQLPHEIVGGVVVGGRAVISPRVARGEHHDDAYRQKRQRKGQERKVQPSPALLYCDRFKTYPLAGIFHGSLRYRPERRLLEGVAAVHPYK